MIAAGFGAPSRSNSSRKNSAVGALPMATTEPARRSTHELHSRGRTGIADFAGNVGRLRFAQGANHVIPGWQARAGNPMGDHEGITEDRRAILQRLTCCRNEAWRKLEILRGLHQSAGMNHANGKIGLFLGKAGQIGFAANDGKRALVDGIAIPDIIVFRHLYPC